MRSKKPPAIKASGVKSPPHPLNYLRAWRERGHPSGKKLTLEQAANIIGISVSLLSERERGMKPVDTDHLEKMAKEFNCEPWMLLLAAPNAPQTEAIRRAYNILDGMDHKQREAWFLLGESLKESVLNAGRNKK